MLKKTIALAAGLSLLTGCITSNQFANLSKTLERGTLFIRSMTVSDPKDGDTKVTNFLGWVSLGGKTPLKLERDGAEIADSSKLQNNSYNDVNSLTNALSPGQTYNYALTFGESTATQSIIPAIFSDTRLTSTSPNLSDTVPAGSTPKLTWTRKGAQPKGFVVTVAKMPSDFAGSSLGAGEPTYIAFLDAASHPTSVVYGTPSNLAAITEEKLLSETLGKMEGGFFAQKNEPLTPGRYAWTVVSLDHDETKTAFAINKPSSLGIFTVQ